MPDPVTGLPRRRLDAPGLAAAVFALLWGVFCLLWFDVAAPWRPAVLAGFPPLAVLAAAALFALAWLWGRRHALCGPALGSSSASLALVLALAFFSRLPVTAAGAAATVTSDGALSGIVALHVLDGSAHEVFVPHVPYSGSLKSHLTAALALGMDPAQAFALASVFFYLLYVAGLFRIGLLVGGEKAALLAGLYAAFSPPFLTRYSLSNDGNYVEVLALGTWALWLGARWTGESGSRGLLAFAAGLLLGLAFWCHILAVIHAAALAALFVAAAVAPGRPDGGALPANRRSGLPSSAGSLVSLGAGWAIGYAPGWLWNAANDWASFRYLLPGEARPGEPGDPGAAPGILEKLRLMVTDHWPVLMGYDTGYGALVNGLLLAVAWVGVAAAVFAAARMARRAWRERSGPIAALLLFAGTNLTIALLALPHVPGNPRYLLFLMSVVPVFLADALGSGPPLRGGPSGWWQRPLVLALLIATGAVSSFAQVPPTLRQDARWREFVADMEREGVRFCYTDFFLATRVNFLSRERIVCSAKLGPITTEYFFEYRRAVERAPEAAFIAVNRTSADRLVRRLGDLGVACERKDLLKPVLLRLSRKVDPEELFPGREFPMR